MTTIYTSKKTGATYTMKALENGKFQLTSTEDSNNIITTTESVLKRWYKKSIVVDFTNAEEKPVEEPTTTKKASKKDSKKSNNNHKKTGPRAKSYEEQKWGLNHTRISLATFCGLLSISELEFHYNPETQTVSVNAGECKFSRRVNKNELTGSVWFRFKNAEYELTDMEYISTEAA